MIFLDHRLWHPDMHGDRDPDDPPQLPDGGQGGGAGGLQNLFIYILSMDAPCKQIQRPCKCKLKDQSSQLKIFLKSTILDVAFSFVAAALLITAGGGKDDDTLLV